MATTNQREKLNDPWWGGEGEGSANGFFSKSTGVRPTKRSKFRIGMETRSGIYEVVDRHHGVGEVPPRSVRKFRVAVGR